MCYNKYNAIINTISEDVLSECQFGSNILCSDLFQTERDDYA